MPLFELLLFDPCSYLLIIRCNLQCPCLTGWSHAAVWLCFFILENAPIRMWAGLKCKKHQTIHLLFLHQILFFIITIDFILIMFDADTHTHARTHRFLAGHSSFYTQLCSHRIWGPDKERLFCLMKKKGPKKSPHFLSLCIYEKIPIMYTER